jgi:predicted GNAT family acetyltransferase
MITTGNLENVDIRHDSDNRKYDAWDGGEVVGVVVYELLGGHITITHAAVQESQRGHGIGAKLIGSALDDLQAIGGPIRVTCPVVHAFIQRNPRYAHLLPRP